MHNSEGQAIEVAQGNPVRVWLPLDGPSEGALIARLV
jgi:putative protease